MGARVQKRALHGAPVCSVLTAHPAKFKGTCRRAGVPADTRRVDALRHKAQAFEWLRVPPPGVEKLAAWAASVKCGGGGSASCGGADDARKQPEITSLKVHEHTCRRGTHRTHCFFHFNVSTLVASYGYKPDKTPHFRYGILMASYHASYDLPPRRTPGSGEDMRLKLCQPCWCTTPTSSVVWEPELPVQRPHRTRPPQTRRSHHSSLTLPRGPPSMFGSAGRAGVARRRCN